MLDRRKEPARLGPRKYDHSCPVSGALNLVGDRWALPVLKELQFGGRRFSELKASLPGLSARALSLRLTQLEERGLVEQVRLLPASVNIYRLTERGMQTRPFILELVRWAVSAGIFDPAAPGSGPSFAVSILAMIEPAPELPELARIAFKCPATSLLLEIKDGEVAISMGDRIEADATLCGSLDSIAGYLFGRTKLGEAIDRGSIELAGDLGLIRQLPSCFPKVH